MNRDQKIRELLGRGADDARRLSLDRIDAHARNTGTWGTREHRDSRDAVEREHDEKRHLYERLSDQQLDEALVAVT